MQHNRYGGLGLRLLATLIDVIVLAIPIWATESLIRQSNPELETQDVIVAAEVFKFLLWWVYIAGLTASSWQGTVGKHVLKLKVVDLEHNRIGFGRATLRYLALFPSILLLLVGIIAIALNKRKRGLHDVIAGTLVVREG